MLLGRSHIVACVPFLLSDVSSDKQPDPPPSVTDTLGTNATSRADVADGATTDTPADDIVPGDSCAMCFESDDPHTNSLCQLYALVYSLVAR